MQETQEMPVRSPGWEDTLEGKVVNQSSILAWRIPWTKEPRAIPSVDLQRADATERQHTQAWMGYSPLTSRITRPERLVGS